MQIISLTEKGIGYIDENEESGFIDFKECNDNWIRYRKKEMKKKGGVKTSKFGNYVGQRDSGSDPRYIEFFTKPFARFEFEKDEGLEDYKRLRDHIIQSGWNTIDLS